MKITRRQLRKLVSEIVQIPTPKPGQRMVHKVEEDVTEEMLEDVISILPIWEAGEYEQAVTLIQDLHSLGKLQIHNLMNAAEEMKNYGQFDDSVPEWVSDYFEEKLVASLYERKHRTKRINEAMENPPFQFSISPKDYIDKDQDIEDINQMIRLILESEEINYASEERLMSRRPSVMFQFGYVDHESADPDPRSYQAYLELRRILEEIGFPTHEDILDDRTLRYKTYVGFSESVGGDGTQVGYIFLHQYPEKRK